MTITPTSWPRSVYRSDSIFDLHSELHATLGDSRAPRIDASDAGQGEAVDPPPRALREVGSDTGAVIGLRGHVEWQGCLSHHKSRLDRALRRRGLGGGGIEDGIARSHLREQMARLGRVALHRFEIPGPLRLHLSQYPRH